MLDRYISIRVGLYPPLSDGCHVSLSLMCVKPIPLSVPQVPCLRCVLNPFPLSVPLSSMCVKLVAGVQMIMERILMIAETG